MVACTVLQHGRTNFQVKNVCKNFGRFLEKHIKLFNDKCFKMIKPALHETYIYMGSDAYFC